MTSQINSSNIDGSYPVANQDNNSQGFRDNFTNIKVNFQTAAAELTDLQDKVLLKAALTGTTLNNNMNEALLIAAQIQDFSAAKVTVSETVGAITINYSAGHYQSINTSGSITLSFINFPTSGQYGYVKLQINVTNTAHTVTLPAAVSVGTAGIQGYSAGTITFSATGKYEFAFGSYDGGLEITIFDLNRALTNFSGADLTLDDVTASGNVSATGNVIGGNLVTAGTVSATGNVSGGNIATAGLVLATGNVSGGNITTAGLVSATGNVTGGNVRGFVRPTAGSASQAPLVLTAGTNTSVPAPGAFEYDGVLFYSTATASSRGLTPTEYFVALSTNYTANDSASAQKVFNVPSAGAISLAASTTYMFEGMYYIAPAITFNAVTLSTLFALSGTLTSIRYTAETTVGLSSAVTAVKRTQAATAISTVVSDAAPGGAATNFTVYVRGIVRTDTAGTFTPQIAFSGTPGSAPVVQANSWFKIMPVGNSSATYLGNWS